GFGMYKEHTQRRQIGSAATSRFLRNCKASRPFRISDKDRSRVFPKGRWKKHGRTSPLASTTAETQGALQRGATGSICPRQARKCCTMRRSLNGLSAMKPDDRSRECSLIKHSISRPSASTSSPSRAILFCNSAGETEGRLNAEKLTSAARNEMEFRPISRAESAVARKEQ